MLQSLVYQLCGSCQFICLRLELLVLSLAIKLQVIQKTTGYSVHQKVAGSSVRLLFCLYLYWPLRDSLAFGAFLSWSSLKTTRHG
ncbi:hypothetical protein EMCRGX_G033723 [Ephydatia muelleri]